MLPKDIVQNHKYSVISNTLLSTFLNKLKTK